VSLYIMFDILVCVFLVLMLVLMSLLEYKQKIENIEFKQKIASMRYQMRNLDTDDDKGEEK